MHLMVSSDSALNEMCHACLSRYDRAMAKSTRCKLCNLELFQSADELESNPLCFSCSVKERAKSEPTTRPPAPAPAATQLPEAVGKES